MIYYEVTFTFVKGDGNSETEEFDTLTEALRVIEDGFRQSRITGATIAEKVDE